MFSREIFQRKKNEEKHAGSSACANHLILVFLRAATKC